MQAALDRKKRASPRSRHRSAAKSPPHPQAPGPHAGSSETRRIGQYACLPPCVRRDRHPRRIGDLALRCVPEEVTLSDLRWSTPSAQVTAVISSSLWRVYDVADEAYLLRRGHVICSNVSDAARHKPPCRCCFSILCLLR